MLLKCYCVACLSGWGYLAESASWNTRCVVYFACLSGRGYLKALKARTGRHVVSFKCYCVACLCGRGYLAKSAS